MDATSESRETGSCQVNCTRFASRFRHGVVGVGQVANTDLAKVPVDISNIQIIVNRP